MKKRERKYFIHDFINNITKSGIHTLLTNLLTSLTNALKFYPVPFFFAKLRSYLPIITRVNAKHVIRLPMILTLLMSDTYIMNYRRKYPSLIVIHALHLFSCIHSVNFSPCYNILFLVNN